MNKIKKIIKKIIKNDFKFITIEGEILKSSDTVENREETNKKLLSVFKNIINHCVGK